ncbi:MAG: putative Stringent starvation protein [Pseudomonadota bacterium]|jgi:stringent starvation protein B
MKNALDSTSTRPYLIRALYDWCADNGLTPYVAVMVDETVQVPREYVKDGEIVLNISFDATSALKLGNEYIEFKARFGGVARDIHVPVSRVLAIYARENGQGMAFPVAAAPALEGAPGASPLTRVEAAGSSDETASTHMQLVPIDAPVEAEDTEPPRPPSGSGARPSLKRVK